MENLAQIAQTGTSGATQAAVQAPSRFDAFISKLHAWKQLPVVHTSKVHTSGAVLNVLIRTAQNDLLLPTDIFLMTGAAYAGPVNRVVFSDQMTGETAEVDVLLCSACIICRTMNSTTLSPQPRVPLPIVHNSDLSHVDAHGIDFLPKDPSATLTAVHSEDNYQMHVYFTGGKRVLVEVVE
jgi:hypothetical protein